jgi:serine phosphatase RsbU (regulator of sigma subunit)
MSALEAAPPTETLGRGAPGAAEPEAPHVVGSWRPSAAAVWVLLAAILVTAALTVTSLALYDHNESRLLKARGRELALLLTSAVSGVETPLASAAGLAEATNASPQKFDAFLIPRVGPGNQFVSASLWRSGALGPIAVVGSPPALSSDPAYGRLFLAAAAKRSQLSVTRILAPGHPRLGYAYRVPGSRNLLVYAESLLPADRHSRLQGDSAFSSLYYALYLGTRARQSNLLVSDTPALPARGRTATDVIPFASSHLTVVVSPVGSLSGSFFRDLPTLVAILGLLLGLVAAGLTDRLVSRRRRAEELAVQLEAVAQENRALYNEQRSIAQQLQHALLPDTLPTLDGLAVSARYVPGISGIDVGGDWYDIVELDPGHVVLVVGDVSGRGLRAATTMSSLRNSIIAFASQDPEPATVLSKLSHLVSGRPHEYFATVLYALVDIDAHEMRVASAGHLPPLLLEHGEARFVQLPVGAPAGATSNAKYEQTMVSVSRKATLIGFTDGLVERRGESLDAGLERLRAAASAVSLPLDQLVTKLLEELSHDDGRDDTAILAVRWRD